MYDEKDAKETAKKVGYPVMIKAVLGGGGKGMRTAKDEEEFVKNFAIAQAEAKQSLAMMLCILSILLQDRAILNFRFLQILMEM